MARKLNCAGCGAYMGEVRDASLRKDLVCHCEKCVRELKAKAGIRQAANQGKPFGGMFDDIWGGNWRG